MFSRFDTIPECDRHMHRHTTTAYIALSIASRGNEIFDDKNEIFAQTLRHKIKKQNKTGLVEKFYTIDVLAVYRTYLPKVMNVALNLLKLLQKIYCLFEDTV